VGCGLGLPHIAYSQNFGRNFHSFGDLRATRGVSAPQTSEFAIRIEICD
jgi:hypothetical protein